MSAEVTKEVVATERVTGSPPAAVATSPSSVGPGDPARHLPPFSSFAGDNAMDSSTTLTTLHSQDVGLGLTSSWDYYEGLTGRLIDSRGEVVLASQYRPWESKNAVGGGAPTAAPAAEGLPSFASQFTAPSEAEPQLTALTPLSPASISHSPPVTSAVGLPSFHTLGTPLPAPHPHRGSVGYPLVPAPVQAREVPALQQQLLDERHIQLLGSSPVQAFPPPPPGHPHHTVLTVVKPEYPQLHHANFQNPMSTVLDSSPTSRPIGIDGRKKERRKMRAGSMESEDSAGAGNVESSGQVAAVSSTANRGAHHLGGGMADADGDGGLSDKPAKKKRKRCGECIGCQRKDNCGDCAPCRNDKSHQICKMRRCEKLTEKKIKNSAESHIVLDCSTERIYDVLKQAQQIGMMSDYHSYLITSLDLHSVDLEEFKHGGTNITAFRLVDPEKQDIQKVVQDWIYGEKRYNRELDMGQSSNKNNLTCIKTETSLMYDAVHLFAKALHDLDTSQQIDIKPLSCESTDTWPHGYSLINYMKIVEMTGLTGIIKFDHQGFRSDFILDIIELNNKEGLKKIGTWNSTKGINFTRSYKEEYTQIVENLQNKTFIVTTILSAPYCMRKDSSEKLTGNAQFEGYSVDLIYEISRILGFNYTFRLVPDGRYGSYNKKTKEWDGMMKELLDQKADLAIADLTITYDREQAVDFTMPFMNLGISILYRKPIKQPPNLFSFLSPLSLDVWIYMATAYLGVSVLLFILARFTPYEWYNPHPCNKNPDHLENRFKLLNCMWFTIGSLMRQGCDILPKFSPYEWENPHPCNGQSEVLENEFTLMNSLWFTIGSLMQQGSDIAPKAVSTRIVAGMWWFFTLIMISSYTANLAAFLTVERMDSPIESAEDLAKQTKIKYGALKGGSTAAFFRDSNFSTYQRMWSFMDSAKPTVFTTSNVEGVERVVKGKGSYAFLMESTSIEYVIERNCDLTQVGGLLDSKGYGIAMPPNSPYRTAISGAILKLQEEGKLHLLKTRWWKEKRGGGSCRDDMSKSSSTANELGLANVGGVFVVLMGGMGIACVIAVCEFVWKSRKVAIEERKQKSSGKPICEAFTDLH